MKRIWCLACENTIGKNWNDVLRIMGSRMLIVSIASFIGTMIFAVIVIFV